ncbi:MAG: RES family NAD+ phosphorylase [Gammaproteobacteria bacterium]|nr:RES family NAD+ phosphorylase [Gammaproteobacteria bacterium]
MASLNPGPAIPDRVVGTVAPGGRKTRSLTRRVRCLVHRIVPSRFPPVGVFDGLVEPDQIEHLFAIEALTNPRLRQEIGEIHLVAPEDRLTGPGTTPIMAAFCHPNRAGSRFSDGSYGIYYAALEEETAIAESAHHRARFLRATAEPPLALEMRRYVCQVARTLVMVPADPNLGLLEPDDYRRAQAFGREQRAAGAWGLFYPSVRRAGGRCIAALRPPALKPPAVQASHYRYYWNGRYIDRIERIQTLPLPAR